MTKRFPQQRVSDVIVDFKLDWGDTMQMRHAAAARAFALSAAVSAEAYPGEGTPPYVAHVYLRSYVSIFLGTVAHPDRWPTLAEIEAAVRAWRAEVKLESVTWVVDPASPPSVHCATCTCNSLVTNTAEARRLLDGAGKVD